MESLEHENQRSSGAGRAAGNERSADDGGLGESAIETLDFFERYAGAVYAFFARRGFAARQCRECTQETFMGLDRQREEAAGERDEIRLFKVAAQIWQGATGGQADNVMPGRQSATLAELEARRPGAAPAADGPGAARWRRLREAVAALPGASRRALICQIDQGLDEHQIAILLQVSLTTIKAHLRDARQRLRTMLGEDEAQRLLPALRALVADTRRQLLESSPRTIHVDDLVAYHGGTLAEDERERLQELLAYSPQWSRLLLDLDHFPDVVPPRGVEPLVGEDLLEQKQCLEKRLEELEGPTRVLAFPVPGETGAAESAAVEGPVWSSRLVLLLLLAVIMGLGLWIAALHQKVGELAEGSAKALFEPLPDVAIHELFPRSGPTEVAAAQLSTAVPHTVVLNSLERRVFPDYRIDLVAIGTGGERLAWRGSGFTRSLQGSFSLLLPPGFPGPGRYRVELYGLREDVAEPLESFGELLIE